LEKICSSYSNLKKEFGEKTANKLSQRLSEIRAASSLQFLLDNRIGRCHSLSNNRTGQ